MIVVTKFGGSSLADSKQFQKVKKIIDSNPLRKVVIVSALGKRSVDDSKITDLLYLLAAHLKYKVDYSNIYQMIKERYLEIAKDLGLKIALNKEFLEIEKHFYDNNIEEYLVSRGEYLVGKMMAEYLDYQFVDSVELIRFQYNGKLDDKKTESLIRNKFELLETGEAFKGIVIPGFYGTYPNQDIKLFSRGGSDITGSLVAKAICADKYENWTDVSGILMADPHIIEHPKQIKEITYDELRELSYMGASVLHEETIFPIQDLNIPIQILNTNDPSNEGTIISNSASDKKQIITGIAGKKGFKSITIVKKRSANKLDVIRDVLNIFASYHVTIEHIPTSIDAFSIVVESKLVDKCLYEIIGEIKNNPNIIDVSIDDNISLIAIVGRNMVTKPGISGKIFAIFGNQNINIKMIAQGSKELNIIIGIANDDFEKSIKAVYDNMVN